MESKKYQLNREDGLKIAKGASIALGGALIVYVAEILPQIEFGSYTPLVVALGGVIINFLRKWLKNQ